MPARNEQDTIGLALDPLIRLRDAGEIHQLVVVDESTDYTSQVARERGVEVYRQSELHPDLGPVCGKGDAMWRSLSILTGDIILWLDADSTTIAEHYVWAMTAPILAGQADMVKGYYRRSLGTDPDGGGRVNHLVARPLLKTLFPKSRLLHEIRQPLAGETAMTRELAWRLPFVCGYGVEMGLLLDAHGAHARIAQADLHEHDHRHRSLTDLAKTSEEVMRVALHRAGLTSGQPWTKLTTMRPYVRHPRYWPRATERPSQILDQSLGWS